MKNILTILWACCILTIVTPVQQIQAKENYTVTLLTSSSDPTFYGEQIKKEITALLGQRFNLTFTTHTLEDAGLQQATQTAQSILADNRVRCLIGLTLDASEALAQLPSYPKPVIASAILDHKVQRLPLTSQNTSGINNFNYIQSPFDIEKDLKTFKTLIDFKHLAIFLNSRDQLLYDYLYDYLRQEAKKVSPAARVSIVETYPNRIPESVAAIPDDVDAVYIPPVFIGEPEERIQELIDQINDRKLPSFALLGESAVQKGALASIAPDRNFTGMARRVALNLLNIIDGQNGGDLPVTVSNYTDNFVVNVATMRLINYFPSWKSLNEARLINLLDRESGRKLSLPIVIHEALEANLDLRIQKLDTQLQATNVGQAKAPLLPQANLSSSYGVIDDNRAGNPGSPAEQTWSATATVSQLLFSDDALANHSIQKLLYEASQHQETTQLLDTVVEATQAYITLLLAYANQVIENNNLAVTRRNLDIARNKEAIGTVDVSEVYRWKSEQAANQISLNDAFRDVQLAQMSLNQILDRPVKELVSTEEINLDDTIDLMITDPEVHQYLENYETLTRFGEFLVVEADRNLPELKDISAVIKGQKREVKNRKRAYYLPDFQLTGQLDKILDEHGIGGVTPSELDHPWSITATASWPIFAGNSRSHELAQSKIRLNQLQVQSRNLEQQLHLRVHSNLQIAAVSGREVELSHVSLEAANRNFEIIQAGYSEGRNTIADLIDAQNAKRNAELGEAIAKYQFVLDFIVLERSIGRFHFLDTSQQKMDFRARLNDFMSHK